MDVIPNGVDTEYFQINGLPAVETENALVFTGSMDWLPNEDSAVYYCKEILPLIWKTKSDVKFYIVGKKQLYLFPPASQPVKQSKCTLVECSKIP